MLTCVNVLFNHFPVGMQVVENGLRRGPGQFYLSPRFPSDLYVPSSMYIIVDASNESCKRTKVPPTRGNSIMADEDLIRTHFSYQVKSLTSLIERYNKLLTTVIYCLFYFVLTPSFSTAVHKRTNSTIF
ncbi:uncharacterized protein LOC143343237 [Colletes latitarsis]|uniref:uncharacterized protein LOC143343237 n=1 Tax=Colletes latitarsis TaxID=2605962 RepID=UPI004035C782